MAGTTGLEPATSAVTGQRSNQLSYVPSDYFLNIAEAPAYQGLLLVEIFLLPEFCCLWPSTLFGQTESSLVAEVAHPGEYHGDAQFVRCGNHLVVTHRASGLNHRRGSGLHHNLKAIGEGKEGV